MAASPRTPDARGEVVQAFHPTTGSLLGWTGLVALSVALLLTLVTERGLTGLEVATGLALFMVLTWVTLLRPRAHATATTLTLHNMLRDTELPLAGVEEVVVRQVLHVWVGDERYSCIGIGRSRTAMLGRRKRGPMAFLGLEQTDDRMGAGSAGDIGASADYATFVETRIMELAGRARERRPPDGATPVVRRSWARVEGTLLLALTGLLVLLLLVDGVSS